MGNGLHGDFDRGYFSAWADCMRIISRMDVPAPEKPAEEGEEKAEQAQSKIETTRKDHSQATIANFLKETKENENAVEEENKSIEAHKQ
jgi:hypothetical protein